MHKYFLLSFLWCLSLTSNAQHPPVFDGMVSDTSFIKLNDFSVNLVRYAYKNPTVTFLAIHDNEDTGVKAAFEYIKNNGGKIIDSQYGGARNFKFLQDKETFQIDPNGIYTREGIKAGLEKYGKSNNQVIHQLERAAKVVLNYYNPEALGYILTLHNNGDGDFGIASYLKDYELDGTADSLHINFQMDPDDLILVTEQALYKEFKKQNVNVVLQSKDALNDGSLSIYAMQKKIPYINVEVQHGHQEVNLKLIELAVKVLFDVYPKLKKEAR